MIKTLAVAAVLSLGLAGYAVAQERRSGARRSDGARDAPSSSPPSSPSSSSPSSPHAPRHGPGSRRKPRVSKPTAARTRRLSRRNLRLSGQRTVRRAFLCPGLPQLRAGTTLEAPPRSSSARTRLRVLTSTRGPSASRTTAPHSVRTSCWVSSMRWKMLRRFRRMPGFLVTGRKKPFSSSFPSR